MIKIFFISFSLIVLCFSFEQTIILYTGVDQTGEGLIIKSKRPNLLPLSPEILTNVKSLCVNGEWRFFDELNYTGYSISHYSWNYLACYNDNLPSDNVASLRYQGPSETDMESISFYNDEDWHGEEVMVTSSSHDIGFPPRSIFSTGWSNWTFFSDKDFEGTALCFISNREAHYIREINSTLAASIVSLKKGCGNSTTHYMFGNSKSE